ncbi:MAG TPA: hypothetical protein VNS88_00710 [Nitrospiraceae bacterium]|nr:hypothetical protein [Nitrospiraceae bacterium]
MADDIDNAAAVFQSEIAPGQQPRNEHGQYKSLAEPVERLFVPREVEEDESGDTGEDRPARRRVKAKENGNGDEAPSDDESDERSESDEGEGSDAEDQEAEEDSGEGPDGESDEADGEDGPHYEIKVDGETKTVSLKEALEGYIRTDTFHQRMNKVSEAAQIVSAENVKNQQVRDYWIKRAQDLEAEFTTLLPQEPDWDKEFSIDPAAAHRLKKQYDQVNGKLETFRQERAQQEQLRAQEQMRMDAEFSRRGQEKFVNDHQLHDEVKRTKVVNNMRSTAFAHGFNEKEVSEVFDPRMLDVLYEASEYRRIMANKPKAVIPGKNKTLTPGSGNGNGTRAVRRTDRKGIDAAQRKLAASGSLDDAADFFKTVLR